MAGPRRPKAFTLISWVASLLWLGGCSSPSTLADAGTRVDAGPDAGAATSDAGVRDASTPIDGGSDGGGTDGGGTDGGGGDAGGTPFVYVGSGGGSIFGYRLAPDTGALTLQSETPTATVPSFLAFDPSLTHLYAVGESTNEVLAYAIGRSTGALTFLNRVSSGGAGPAHLSVEPGGHYVLVANYGGATVSVLPILPGGGLGPPTVTVATGLNPHMAIADPGNHFALVPCLGSDEIAQFLWDAGTGTLTPNPVPAVATDAGAGPRHLAFGVNRNFAYLINETDNTMAAYGFNPSSGRFTAIQVLSTLPPGFTGTSYAAELQVHPSGRFLYGSNRGDDSIVAYALDATTGQMALLGHTSTGGLNPRHFSLDPAGDLLLAGNQGSNDIMALRVDPDAGTLSPIGPVATVPAPMFVGVVTLP